MWTVEAAGVASWYRLVAICIPDASWYRLVAICIPDACHET